MTSSIQALAINDLLGANFVENVIFGPTLRFLQYLPDIFTHYHQHNKDGQKHGALL